MTCVLFTKTNWTEPPRLRHQVADLLVERGHEIVFFEQPTGTRPSPVSPPRSLALVRSRQLLHHQLRFSRVVSRLNAEFEKAQIRQILGSKVAEVVIINFNYDYYFLRDLFPRNTIITVINDDFLGRARFFSRREAERVLRDTVRLSDHTLAVSYPLLAQVKKFTPNVSLFLPWARRSYVRPKSSQKGRTELIYWGYINDRIDYQAVRHVLDSGIKVNFVGPIDGSLHSHQLVKHPNATYHGQRSLDDLGNVLESCAASILPYDITCSQVAAGTVPNRAFDILACGLPLLFRDLPGLISAPEDVIYRCTTGPDYVVGLRQAADRFDASQPSIQRFLAEHTPSSRYRQLSALLPDTEMSARTHQ